MMIPTVHSNGTGKEALLEELLDASLAIEKAIDRLCHVTVHGRDFYPQGPAAYTQAREEMNRRFQMLQSIVGDLQAMYQAIEAQR